jgi:hypothetical protein
MAAASAWLSVFACASAPAPRTLDGADRVPINDAATVCRLTQMAEKAGKGDAAPRHQYPPNGSVTPNHCR